jgi:RNA polymerase sigma-70 factor (ECF subfamily)
MQRFVDSEWRRGHALRRGGGAAVVALDDDMVEAEVARLQQDDSPEEAYDRRWAALMLERGMARLESETTQAGRAEWFGRLRRFLSEQGTNEDYAEAGAPLGLSVNAVAQAVLRLRGRYREAVRAEITDTLEDPATADEEMAVLVSILTGR